MNKEHLFTVLIPHYNQQELWKTAIQSVLKQTYPSIELIFIDDASDSFDPQAVETFIQQHSSDNLKNYKILVNKKNLGTVRSLNHAHQYCNGHYILHFAADDCLYDQYVLSNFVVHLEQKPDDVLGIYGKSLKCDQYLKHPEGNFLPIEDALQMNAHTARQQFTALLYECIFPLGATAFVLSQLKRFLPFDEEYFLHEDWPFFLRSTRSGQKFIFVDFPALLYRAGGVSRPITPKVTKTRELLFRDCFILHEKEIFPYTKELKKQETIRLLKHYDDIRSSGQPFIGNTPLIKRYHLISYNIHFIEAFWSQFNFEQKYIFSNIFFNVFAVILDIMIINYLWKQHFCRFVIVILLLQIIMFILLIICFRKKIISEYNNIKYYLFSPYR